MRITRQPLEGILEIVPARHCDERGFFTESYNADSLAKEGINIVFVQDNHSLSVEKHVLRGLHFQTPPLAQDKLVRVLRGRVFDVAVDIRVGSPTFSHWIGVELSAEKGNQLLVPKGFAHGFLTLEPNCEIQYKVSALYSSKYDRSIRFDDPNIAIEWPILEGSPVLSDKDKNAPFLTELETGFAYGE